jgi:hypothetical protein
MPKLKYYEWPDGSGRMQTLSSIARSEGVAPSTLFRKVVHGDMSISKALFAVRKYRQDRSEKERGYLTDINTFTTWDFKRSNYFLKKPILVKRYFEISVMQA